MDFIDELIDEDELIEEEDIIDTDSEGEEEEKKEVEEEEDEDDEEDEPIVENIVLKVKERRVKITIPILTIYERTQVLAFRAQQIMNNSPVLVDVSKIEGEITPYSIALLELSEKRIPFKVKRNMPDNTYELWNIEDFKNI